jgi:circadian clock protein KaiC
MNEEFIKTGVPGFDELLGNMGIPKGFSVVFIGGPGCGKTLLSLQICNNLSQQGKKCLFWSLNETEERIKMYMKQFGWDINENLIIRRGETYTLAKEVESIFLNKRGVLPYKSPEESFFGELKKIAPDFFVLDSLTAISSIFIGEKQMYRVYLEELFKVLNSMKITSILICEEVKGIEGYEARVEEFFV